MQLSSVCRVRLLPVTVRILCCLLLTLLPCHGGLGLGSQLDSREREGMQPMHGLDALPPRALHALPGQGLDRVSVVMLNWLRPTNVIKIMRTYVEYGCVEEVIIWMCREDTRFNFSHPKVRVIDDVSANNKHGLSTRFKACLLSRTPWVFIQDDDHFMKERGLTAMIAVKHAFPRRIVGAFGRDWPRGEPARYLNRRARAVGPCRIVLTVLMLTDVETCQAFWHYSPLVEPFVRNSSRPLWNGEDIFYSLVSYKVTGELPLIVHGDKVFMSQKRTGIHSSFGDHLEYRDAFLRHAVDALRLEFPPEAWEAPNSTRAADGEGAAAPSLGPAASPWGWLKAGTRRARKRRRRRSSRPEAQGRA